MNWSTTEVSMLQSTGTIPAVRRQFFFKNHGDVVFSAGKYVRHNCAEYIEKARLKGKKKREAGQDEKFFPCWSMDLVSTSSHIFLASFNTLFKG